MIKIQIASDHNQNNKVEITAFYNQQAFSFKQESGVTFHTPHATFRGNEN